MKLSAFAASCVLFLTLATGSLELQAQDKNPEYLIESTNLKELKKYKWKEVKRYFKDFDKKQQISLRVKFNNAIPDPEKKGKIEELNIAVSAEARNADNLIDKMKVIIDELSAKF